MTFFWRSCVQEFLGGSKRPIFSDFQKLFCLPIIPSLTSLRRYLLLFILLLLQSS